VLAVDVHDFSKIVFTSSGARPSDGSSSIRNFGLLISAQASFGFFEIDPAVKLAPAKFARLPGGGLQFDVQLDRGAPTQLILERTDALGSPFVTVTNSPQLLVEAVS